MDFFLKNIKIIDQNSLYNEQRVDIWVQSGIVRAVGIGLSVPAEVEIFDYPKACVSVGFIDVGAQANDPGKEHREDLESLCEAAQAGGFTTVAVQPNTLPTVHSKTEVAYILNKTASMPVEMLPIGAVSENAAGKDLTELYDMHHAGAVAFSDGNKPIQDGGLLLRALQYVTMFDGLVMNHPHDQSVANGGQMHEGVMSTTLGLRGIPSLAEELMLQRDLRLLEYSGARLHVSNVSTADAVAQIRAAKAHGLRVSCSVAVANLVLDDEALAGFDSNLKLMPPLRSTADRRALYMGLQDGTIDFISSNHTPLEDERKNLEFPYAGFGMIGLETAFALSRTHLKDVLSLGQLVEKWTVNARKILGLPVPSIAVGQRANLTVFYADEAWVFEEKHIRSKSKNTPFVGEQLIGRVVRTFLSKKQQHNSRPQMVS